MADLPAQLLGAMPQADTNEKEKEQQTKSFARMAEARILEDLSSSLETHTRSATFACGGRVSFMAPAGLTGEQIKELSQQDSNSTRTPTANAATVDDVQIRFGPSGSGVTVNFNRDGPSSKDFEKLLKTCQPASFGRAGEAILDEAYRKAGKLDRSQFATTFCPYEAGIVDVVTQLLVPQYKHGKHARSIKADLYKLNVYSAPNGKFKPHVDTPRSKDQIGSLVVSLPSAHQGGQLTVRNAGTASQNVVFDWSTTDDSAPGEIKWAAFCSDCEHEVHEVTSGHRVTLTYNLFLTRGVGHRAGASPALDATQLPLYQRLQDALDNPGFLRRRVLAVYLTHCYAHTSPHANFLPDSLKGADMSLWSTAQALGLKCEVRPIMSNTDRYRDPVTQRYYHAFHPFENESSGGYMFEERERPEWGDQVPEEIVTWLNDKGHSLAKISGERSKGKNFEEVQMAYITYGNQPSMGIDYTRAAMLIRVPPWHERCSGNAEPKSIWAGLKFDAAGVDAYAGYHERVSCYPSVEEAMDEDNGSDSDMYMRMSVNRFAVSKLERDYGRGY